jgi:hypothetical protein
MSSVTLTRMRRGALVLAAAAVMLGVRMFSAAPAMADPLVVTEPVQQPVMNETIIDEGLGLFGLNNGFVDVDEPGIFSVDHDFDHDKGDHKADKSDIKADKSDIKADKADLRADQR